MNREELQRVVETDPEKAIDAALEAFKSPDRNTRVRALRVLAGGQGNKAAAGVLAGLSDPKRRVRDVAIKVSRPYLDDPQVIARLQEMVEDEEEKDKLRSQALAALSGHYPHERGARIVPQSAVRALETMSRAEKHRSAVLWRLLQMDLTEDVETLLREFVKEGTREQAVMATRALCGYKVVHIGIFPEGERKEIMRSNELAAGRVFYWVKR